jgi:hypothetical protein
VAFLRAQAPPGLDMAVIERALDLRRRAADPDPLFPDRAKLAGQVAACRRLAARAE